MRAIVLSLIVLLAVYKTVRCDDKYTEKYDGVDVDNILNNERLLMSYVNCVLGKGKCTPDGQELKAHIKEALATECSKCSIKQKEGMKKVTQFLRKNKPDVWKEAIEKFDPDGSYREKYSEIIEESGIED